MGPKMSDEESMTPEAKRASYNSRPSRERSPIPANTDTEDSLAPPTTLCNISVNRIVLPTPAPPNKPIFPPLTIGAKRSTTLIPVSKTCCLVSIFKLRTFLCMGSVKPLVISPLPSKAFPNISTTLPRSSLPTGNKI